MIEYRAVRVGLAEVGRPGIDVCVEMHQRQRHPVLAPQREQVLDARCLLFDVLQTCGYVAESYLKVPDIGHIEVAGSTQNSGCSPSVRYGWRG